MKKLVCLLVWLCSVGCFAQTPDTLFVSCSQTVHLRFASELKYVGLGDRVLLAKIVDGSKDFVAVKAREAFEGCTSLSCLEASGAMHSFVVAYREDPGQLVVDVSRLDAGVALGGADAGLGGDGAFSSSSREISDGAVNFEELLSMKQGIYHIGASAYGIEVLCEHLLVLNDVLLMMVSLKNRSAMSYELSEPRFAIESSRRRRRGLQMERAVFPKQVYGLGPVAPGAEGRFVFTFDKLALVRGQVLRVYLYEKGGSRNLVMEFGMDDVNKARRL